MKLFANKISIENLIKAKKLLEEASLIAKTELEQAGTIQLFEICYELSWKSMQKIMVQLGLQQFNSPRSVFKEASKISLINNIEIWLESINQRNLTVHTYQEDLAEDVIQFIPLFIKELNLYIENIKKYES